MNIDANIQKLLTIILKKWKLIILFAFIGCTIAYFCTSNFTTLTYSSSVEFLAYSYDSNQEFSESSSAAQQASNTSKMNYAIKMLNTYIELFKTNEFNQMVADEINEKYNTSYSVSNIKNSVTITKVADTAMFKVVVRTTNADLSYQIAHQLETSIPEKMQNTNSGLVRASVEDAALKATTSESPNYPKNCAIGLAAGALLAMLYVILRDLLDVRIKSSDDLAVRYEIPVLGNIPEFELRPGSSARKNNTGSGKEL